MEGVANLNQVVSPGFPQNMTFEQGCEEVREEPREYLGDRAFQAEGTQVQIKFQGMIP